MLELILTWFNPFDNSNLRSFTCYEDWILASTLKMSHDADHTPLRGRFVIRRL